MRIGAQRCLESTFKHGRGPSRGAVSANQRRYLTSEPYAPRDIGVLGGGVSGLATAYYLSRELPNANITIYEATDRIGGWLKSKRVWVDDGLVLFEQGPRTLRPSANGLVTAALIQDLGLAEDVIFTPKTSPAAQNRFIYYPDHIVRMPSPGSTSIWELFNTLWNEPVFREPLWDIIKEPLVDGRPADQDDESVGSFISRRFGSKLVDNIVSAVVHGIYAGDVYSLSMKSLFPRLWYLEGTYDSVIVGAFAERQRQLMVTERNAEVVRRFKPQVGKNQSFANALSSCSVFSLRSGLDQLVHRLVERLSANRKVKLRMGHKVTGLERESSGTIKVRGQLDGQSESKTHVISTLAAPVLSRLCQTQGGSTTLPSLGFSQSVTVMVVNLYFRNPSVLPVSGFGYLIPRSVSFAQNPEWALGVVFDSDAIPGQDTVPGTKVTVMMGGHWWNGWKSFPDAAQGVSMARSVLARHLQITEEPAVVNAELHVDCIPQYAVGHETRLATAHSELQQAFQGRLRVAGSSYAGVGVNDCLRSANDVARSVTRHPESPLTGLEHFGVKEKWVELRFGSKQTD